MLDPASLYEFESHVDPRNVHAKAMVVTLGSFVDAGHVQRLVDEHLLENLPNHVLARFDTDQLIDYRGHRPPITFERDHFTDYEQPEITLHHVLDPEGAPFLLLTGPEPALQWERMAAAVVQLAEAFDVEQVVTLQSVPMPVPHTRPVGLTRHASNIDLIPGNQPVFGTLRMGASLPSLISLRLKEAGQAAVGLAAHIPQYLGDMDHPAAAIALVEALAVHAGLTLPTAALETKAQTVAAQLVQQTGASEELRQLVAALEERYDQVAAALDVVDDTEDLPTSEELGAQAEAFLKSLGES